MPKSPIHISGDGYLYVRLRGRDRRVPTVAAVAFIAVAPALAFWAMVNGSMWGALVFFVMIGVPAVLGSVALIWALSAAAAGWMTAQWYRLPLGLSIAAVLGFFQYRGLQTPAGDEIPGFWLGGLLALFCIFCAYFRVFRPHDLD